jgi:hypothetical protein
MQRMAHPQRAVGEVDVVPPQGEQLALARGPPVLGADPVRGSSPVTPTTCSWCERLMDGASCTEVDYAAPHTYDTACGDCGVRPGGIHHPGCTVARAPDGCDEQAYGHVHRGGGQRRV